ncbi:Peptidoglycan N-acetylglucosamine deacetylase [Labilithrix luteola]|uniref:Peptidoglycan N-acetylglucosamine deacetylase n=1 Tax=Labilithrix luteola TaxID=1391654 RepID=A0A0K1PYH9_9BACT|nr:polysaccharide deacetylase family protein [Labilithrix luteola]AKU98441.1 Peptidoglycan N-acetylglucosamine deacetylase [Labilithrix luteola]
MLGPLRRQLRAVVKDAVYRAIPRSRLVQRGRTDRRQIALTFDDGPDELTNAYLDRLDELDVRATFFLVGKSCERRPELAREYVRRGHQVASHGYDHSHFTRLPWRELREQLRRTEAVLGLRSTARRWIRPPYGNVDARVLAQLLAGGNVLAMWSLDSHDYEIRDAAEVATRCAARQVSAGEVILLHEGQTWTLEALPRIVGDLRDAGYELVTMAKMFEV